MPLFLATDFSRPVPTQGGSTFSNGTACRCMFEPIKARLASSCSRNGISAAETETVCFGEMSTYSNLIAADGREVTLDAGQLQALLDVTAADGHGIRRGQDALHLFVGTQVLHVAVDLAVLDDAVRRDEEAVLVDVRVDRQRRDEADVGAFRRLDRADSAVVRDVNVTHLEAGPLAVQATRAQGRETTLVGELRQRVRLVDDLRQLAPAEEEVDRAADRLGVDELGNLAQLVRVLEAHALLDGPLELQEALANLLGRQLVDETQTTVAEVVNVVDVPLAVAQGEHVLQRVHEVFAAENHLGLRHSPARTCG